jgi:hypothetical protein
LPALEKTGFPGTNGPKRKPASTTSFIDGRERGVRSRLFFPRVTNSDWLNNGAYSATSAACYTQLESLSVLRGRRVSGPDWNAEEAETGRRTGIVCRPLAQEARTQDMN